MAKCPNCGCEWKWDWGIDIYRDPDGNLCNAERVENDGDQYTCDCGLVLGILYEDALTDEPPEWADIDWEDDEHSYDEDEGKL